MTAMSELVGNRGEISVRPDLEGIGNLYQTALEADLVPQGKNQFLLGRIDFKEGPFSRIETTMTVQSATPENLAANAQLALNRGRSLIQVIPSDSPGYILETNLVQANPELIISGSQSAAIAAKFEEAGLKVEKIRPENIIFHPGEINDPDFKVRTFFPDQLNIRIKEAGGKDEFKIGYYTFPMNCFVPRLPKSLEGFKEELDQYCFGLDTLLEAVFQTLAQDSPSIHVPDAVYKLEAPDLKIINSK